ncbi:hypothetical protein P4S68_05055 [Pseudoalteromonas sp. Hal099]
MQSKNKNQVLPKHIQTAGSYHVAITNTLTPFMVTSNALITSTFWLEKSLSLPHIGSRN